MVYNITDRSAGGDLMNKRSFPHSTDVIFCGWLGSKHELTENPSHTVTKQDILQLTDVKNVIHIITNNDDLVHYSSYRI